MELRHGVGADGRNAHFSSSLGIAAKHFLQKSGSKREPAPLHDVGHNVGQSIKLRVAMQKDSRTPSFTHLMIHSAMGAILGALLALALMIFNRHIFHLIDSSSSPSTEMALFVGFLSFVFAVGATLSGFIFTTIELSAEEAKRQSAVDRRRRQ